MLDRAEFVKTHPDVHTGMTVFSTTGEKLGVIEQIGDDNIMIEKGRIFHKDFSVPFDDIEDVRADEVIIRVRREGEEWEERRESSEYARPEYKRGRAEEETRIPLREEELEARKREREGEVRIHKDVYTETERLEVPVQKEEVRVEHVPAREARLGETTDESAFREEDIRIPVREEEVEVTKRPVVQEEIRVGKETRTEEQEVGGEVRNERVKVDRKEPQEKK